MAFYQLVELYRDAEHKIQCVLYKDGEVVWKNLRYPMGMDYVYKNIQEGDTFQERYLDGKESQLLTFVEMQKSLGMKAYLQRHNT